MYLRFLASINAEKEYLSKQRKDCFNPETEDRLTFRLLRHIAS